MISLLLAQIAFAVDATDGTVDADYGLPLAVQTVNTGFGDNQSELNAVYATYENGTVFLMLTGNLEANYNTLEIWVDGGTGAGQNIVQASAASGGTNPSFGTPSPIFDKLAAAARADRLGRPGSELHAIRVTLHESHVARAWYEADI